MGLVDWAFVALVFWLLSRYWIRAKSAGATAITIGCLVILGAYSLAIGETWYLNYETVSFPLNLFGDGIYTRDDWNPVAALILIALVVGFFARWPLGYALKKYSDKPELPGTTGPAAPAFICVLIALLCTASAGSYIKMWKNQEPGHYTVSFLTTATAGILGAGSEMASQAGVPKPKPDAKSGK
ncbi:MAG: hypothetical protein A2898_05250 [Candidatus Kerfeldbacteria bacterium RIFCSPLOWO2_01_FULL_48_11]|uniref:Uncharacterized protein n=1 Tax=Candidatus Kerfeldbacteria bacterium RIFCSPLOWO2_01_FULL_48_11 TaxID=1798543 RepID=A0A1G2AZS5_9BACT|nr:MAG: hypothetical protein UY34_C0022G0026 [Parcubacteria group bacterium GW2011_GWA2_48_9]KKW15595.1 MAG: hypothetical protein UY52_C0017G0018 [Parcubacteria group bacterium GW2011_GWC2_49_9]OGY82414.1 MAG: hypothetical protein A2898_05250 [Candidatus Kerfeldbacteria bacterium RIFCSPLOWO2_01_FULL_48_11]HCJ52338.1 hypothetical protein [Candidatus Kerfeldbacteria bacterium]HCM67690.1 hypothetical protein [Candidatus Kerfeldbacteria bacterium]